MIIFIKSFSCGCLGVNLNAKWRGGIRKGALRVFCEFVAVVGMLRLHKYF